uniref:Uncharacterized protein n=1 Tax=Chenopodium quinoa TaxID=63459 RepID=A0A803LVP9_CHEQI
MAESVVCLALEKLAALLTAEAELLGSLPRDVRDLQMELGTIKVVLNNAEEKAEEDDTINEWLMQVQTVAYDIEDVIDEFLLLKQQQKLPLRQSYQMISRIRRWLAAEGNDINSAPQRRTLIKSVMNNCKILEFPPSSWMTPRLLELKIVRKNLKLQDHFVIAVVAMGGIGKTTLVRKVYEEVIENTCFDVYAWVTVSQSYKRRDLLMTLFNQVHNEPLVEVDASDEVTICKLRNHLKKMSYIIVFDDVWDTELWRLLKAVLPSNNKDSRILMTTRENNIAQEWEVSLGGGCVYDLEPLPKKEAWDLFTYKVFGKGRCPQDLEESARYMVEKCKGWPLAIVAIAGLLSTKKKNLSEWNKVHNGIGAELGSNPRFSSTKRMLLLSYHELPYHLKPCILYFSMFPEDSPVSENRLVRLWIAEGFVQNQKGKTLEEVAEDYLNELVNRNLVEVDVEDERLLPIGTKRIKSYKVHDILREMIIIPKSENLGFCLHLTKESNFSSTKLFRRFSINQDFANKSVLEVLNSSSTRSLLSLSNLKIASESYFNPLLRVARLLKVSDLENAHIDHAPEELGILQHLQYLCLRLTNIQVLPKSVGKLRNLQTLDLKLPFIVELPKELAHCHKLRHLLAYPREFNFANTTSTVDGLWHLKQLRSLRITKLRKEHGRPLCCAMEEMKHIRSLSIGSMSYDEVLDIQYITTPPPLLERLYLHGLLEKLPEWIGKLNSLTSLHLYYSRLKEDPLPILQGLRYLVELTLEDAYVGEKLDFGLTSFSKLVRLNLYKLNNLESIVGPLPSLQYGDVDVCPKLQNHSESIRALMMPNRLRRIRAHAQVTRAKILFEAANDRKLPTIG